MIFFVQIIKGMLIGTANTISWASGGTTAVAVGLYDELINAVNGFFKEPKKYFPLLFPIMAGLIIGIAVLGWIMKRCMEGYSLPTSMFFAGLAAGSIPLIYKKASGRKHVKLHYIAAAAGLAAVAVMIILNRPESAEAASSVTPELAIKLFAGGGFAAAAMIIPGLNSSFAMAFWDIQTLAESGLSGISRWLDDPTIYETFLHVFSILLPLGAGIILGAVLTIKLAGFLLRKFPAVSQFAILGLMSGAVLGMLFDPQTYQSGIGAVPVITAVLTFASGASASFFLSKMRNLTTNTNKLGGNIG